jgi:hypothetical protein
MNIEKGSFKYSWMHEDRVALYGLGIREQRSITESNEETDVDV